MNHPSGVQFVLFAIGKTAKTKILNTAVWKKHMNVAFKMPEEVG